MSDLNKFVPSLILDERDERDYKFLGGQLNRVKVNPDGNWRTYLPTNEKQATNYYDPYSCVSESLTNLIEMHLSYLMTKDNRIKPTLEKLNALDENGRPNFSGRWLAKMSNTIPGRGNSMKNVADTVRKYGLVGEKVWPKLENMGQSEYYKEIPQDIQDLGKEFLEYFEFGYEALDTVDFQKPYSSNAVIAEALLYSPLWVCVDGRYDWEDGEVGLGKALVYNHAATYVDQEGTHPNFDHWVFDTYEPFLKKFIPDYKFGFIKSIHLLLKPMPELYKKKGEPAIYALNKEDGVLVPFADGVVFGGKLFKTLYGVEDYRDVPRLDVDELPYPIASYSFLTQ